MPTYTYRCIADDSDTERDYPIGTNPRVIRCDCGRPARLVLGTGVYIAAAARPSTKGEVVRIDRRDQSFDKDATAYRRMRDRGLQPDRVDGCAKLEDKVGDQDDITYRAPIAVAKRLGRSKEAVMETVEAVGG